MTLRKMLGNADSPYVVSLMRLIEKQSKTTLCNWCIGYAAQNFLPLYERFYPDDFRPRMAIDAAKQWLKGEVKLPYVKHLILSAHEAAREAEKNPVAQAAARAVGQAASSVHAPTHSLGLAFYGAAAVAYEDIGLEASAEEYDAAAARVFEEIRKDLLSVCVENEPNPAKVNWHC